MRYKLQPKKKLGQHFLIDHSIASLIVSKSGEINDDTTVFEVGPGTGALTNYLLTSKAGRIIAIERDIRCITALKSSNLLSSSEKLEIINGDALSFDERSILSGRNNKIIANLPYNISTALIVKWLGLIDLFSSITVMVQKEVAERIVAKGGSKDFGRISIIAQLLCDIEEVIEVPREAFFPKPKVLSSVIHMIPRIKPLFHCNFDALEIVCKAAFSQRRKMLRSSLKSVFGKNTTQILHECNIDESKRAEEISIEDFCTLSELYVKL
ncbi:16S rRNA (adenine(1518)-N(6)/adenine(1519)-N(6))-dimethyltransferase RsmA [Candidatus Lariskella endosymbiont of Hedychridium roseum]|uniref:16S rRNA (adenine(1518)-N(6)/adenine(1519)-N(6))- dimethyltransferase RsmA n=1 Tax=Candidatus Lariskella endosymbiont of Hedychridium roseum TaxID=3077949 RepID=UPI0030CA841C